VLHIGGIHQQGDTAARRECDRIGSSRWHFEPLSVRTPEPQPRVNSEARRSGCQPYLPKLCTQTADESRHKLRRLGLRGGNRVLHTCDPLGVETSDVN
jgi:hypothetical protein